jgi:hypothetical protein
VAQEPLPVAGGLRDWLVPTTAAAFGTLRTKAAAAFREAQR